MRRTSQHHRFRAAQHDGEPMLDSCALPQLDAGIGKPVRRESAYGVRSGLLKQQSYRFADLLLRISVCSFKISSSGFCIPIENSFCPPGCASLMQSCLTPLWDELMLRIDEIARWKSEAGSQTDPPVPASRKGSPAQNRISHLANNPAAAQFRRLRQRLSSQVDAPS